MQIVSHEGVVVSINGVPMPDGMFLVHEASGTVVIHTDTAGGPVTLAELEAALRGFGTQVREPRYWPARAPRKHHEAQWKSERRGRGRR